MLDHEIDINTSAIRLINCDPSRTPEEFAYLIRYIYYARQLYNDFHGVNKFEKLSLLDQNKWIVTVRNLLAKVENVSN